MYGWWEQIFTLLISCQSTACRIVKGRLLAAVLTVAVVGKPFAKTRSKTMQGGKYWNHIKLKCFSLKGKKKKESTFQKSVTFSPQQHLSSPQKTFQAKNWVKLVWRHEAIMLPTLYSKSLADGGSWKPCRCLEPWQPARSAEPSAAASALSSVLCCFGVQNRKHHFSPYFIFSFLGQDIVLNCI